MNEEQLATLLTEHLDAVLAGQPIPEDVPAEVADLLTVAQTLSEAAPHPDPEFGSALKESLQSSINGGAVAPGSTFSNSTLFTAVIGLLALVGGLALVVSLVVFVNVQANLTEPATPTPVSTPPQNIVIPATTSPTPLPSPTANAPAQTAPVQDQVITPTATSSVPTATPIVDVLPVVTVSIDIQIDPPSLVPGSSGSPDLRSGDSDGGGNSGSGGGNGSGGGDDDDDDDGGDDDDDD